MIDVMHIILIVLSALYIAYVIVERLYNKKLRKNIKLVIHVNGTRGKSTVTRLIDAGLRECGLRVMSKTTGTLPIIIDANNKSCPVKRLGPANIREQLRILEKASEQKVDALVVECMAVNPELQYISENQILNANVNVITNVRADHLDVMGHDLESIAYSLANTVPTDGIVVLGENKFVDIFQQCADKRYSKVFVADPYLGEELLDTFAENIATALKVCEVLNLDKQTFFNGMRKYIHDPGAMATYKREQTVLINGFSINDPDSILSVYNNQVLTKYPAEQITVLLNNRSDRPFRIDQHIEMLTKMKFTKLIVTGTNIGYVRKQLEKFNISISVISSYDELLQEKIIFGCGNFAKDGKKIVEYFSQDDGRE